MNDKPADDASSVEKSSATAGHRTQQMKTTEEHLGQLSSHIEDLQKQHRTLKPQLEQITKTLSSFSFRPGDPLNLTQLPIDGAFIERVKELLKGNGMNIKNLQKGLNIFDLTEMTRKRKALVAAKVTRETQNYQGTNATFVELVQDEDEATTDAGVPTQETGGTGEHKQPEEEITGMEPPSEKLAPEKTVKRSTR